MAVNDYVVVKLGGDVVSSTAMPVIAAGVAELHSAGARVILVHGGGPQVTDLQKRLGHTPRIVGGRRITDAETLDIIKMCVAGQVNVDACAKLLAVGLSPVGLHGASALVVRASKRPARIVTGTGSEPIDFGHVGDVAGYNEKLLDLLLGAGYVPVLACLGADAEGRCYNINADVVANQLAIALRAQCVVIISNVAGVLRDINDPTSRMARLTVAQGRKAIADGLVTGGMIPKLEESFAALERGVSAIHIVGHAHVGHLLAREVSHPGSVGTVLVP